MAGQVEGTAERTSVGDGVPDADVQAVLSRAAALVADGNDGEAIDVLQTFNRTASHPKVARRLLRLRHQAFARVDPTPGFAEWPRALADPFPDVHGRPPEIAAAELTGDLLGGAIVNHGCLLVRGLVDRERVRSLVDDVDRALDASLASFDGARPETTAPWFERFKPDPPWSMGASRRFLVNQGGVLAADCPIAVSHICDLLGDAEVPAVLTDYLGERPALSAKKTTLRRVAVDTGSAWHQDGAFLGEGIRSVNVWLALSDCGVDAPGLDVVPTRLDLVDAGTEGAVFEWSVARTVVDRAANEVGVCRPEFAAGDALLFDDRLLHSTATDPSMANERYALEAWFFAPSHYPTDQVPVLF
jgi:hypothetical protein